MNTRKNREQPSGVGCSFIFSYGHPSARTVEALTRGGARVLRTDRDGAIAVTGAGAALAAVGSS